MIKKIEVTFDFGKLSRKIDKILQNDIEVKKKEFAAMARINIISGNLRPLRQTTVNQRRKGGGKGRPKTGSITPLFYTGKLLSSIKAVSEGIELFEYGWHHNQGFDHHTAGKISPRPFLFTRADNLKPNIKKRFKLMEKELYRKINKALTK